MCSQIHSSKKNGTPMIIVTKTVVIYNAFTNSINKTLRIYLVPNVAVSAHETLPLTCS
jgi:hypothetical protein